MRKMLVLYLPDHVDNGLYNTNAFKTELEAGIETTLQGHDIYLFGNSKTFMTKQDGTPWFEPYIQSYGLGLEIEKDPLQVYARHECSHPVFRSLASDEFITEFGVRYSW